MDPNKVNFLYNKHLKNSNIKEKDGNLIFSFNNLHSYEAAKKSKDFIIDFYKFFNTNPEFEYLKLKRKNFSFAKLLSEDALQYINKMPISEKNQTLSSLRSLSDSYSGTKLRNKMSLFIVNFDRLSQHYAREGIYTSPTNTLKALHKGTIVRETYIPEIYFRSSVCSETYIGFIRAIRAGTLTTAKVMIDGKEKRVFIKSAAGIPKHHKGLENIIKLNGYFNNLNFGHNTIALDPKTFKLYLVKTDGKAHVTREVTTNDLYNPEQRKIKRILKKELAQHLNRVYAKRDKKGNVVVPGIRRMKEMHERMKTKENKTTKETTVKKPKPTPKKPKLRVRPR